MKIYEYNNRHVDDKSPDLLRFAVDNDLDELRNYPQARQLHIAGLKQRDLGYFIDVFADNYDYIHFNGCSTLSDLSALSALRRVKYVAFSWNTKAASLWDMSNNLCLEGLYFNDMSKLRDVSDLETGTTLRELHISGGMWKNATIESLAPIGKLHGLRHLSLQLLNIVDNDPTPLQRLTSLQTLSLDENLFEMSAYAELAATLPHTSCECFNGYIVDASEDGKDIRIVGKNKPRLNPNKQTDTLAKYLHEFNALTRACARSKSEGVP